MKLKPCGKESLKTSLEKNCNYFDQSICPEHVYISWSLDPDLKVFFQTDFLNSLRRVASDNAFSAIWLKVRMGFFVTLRKNIPGIYDLPRKYRKYQVRSQLLSMPNIGQWPSGWEIVRWTMVRVFACRLILVQSTIPNYNFAGTTLHYMAHLPQMCPWSQISRPLAGNVAVCAVKIFTTFFWEILQIL